MALETGRTAAWSRRAALWFWLVGLVACAWVAARSTYVADLSAFLPTRPTAEQAVLLDQLNSGLSARLVLIGIEGGEPTQRAEASRTLADALRADGRFDTVHNGDGAPWREAGAFVFARRYLLSPMVEVQRFSVEGLRAAIEDTLALLGTPAAGLVKPTLLRDPTGEAMQVATALLPAQAPRNEDGVWVSRQAPRAVLVATTRADGADLDGQEQALQQVRRHFAPQAAMGLKLLLSGPGSFAVSSREQIRSEVERLALLGGIGLLLLMWLAFGSARALGGVLLPVGTGVLAGIAAVSLGFGQIHGITLGFGVTLIGEAVDYAIYYLIQAHRRPDVAAAAPQAGGAAHWIRHNWPTVRLGLWTSICGFAALLFSGFPGLVQLGVFSIAGLGAAAVTTRRVLPILAPWGAPGGGLREQLGRATSRTIGLLEARGVRFAVGALTLTALLAVTLLPSAWRGDLVSLSPIGAEALDVDTRLRADLGAAEAGTLLVVSAADEAGVLDRTENVVRLLEPLVADGALAGYDTPTRLLPSPATQARRRAALPDAATLQAALEEATAQGALPAARLGAFIDDVQAARSLPLLDRAALAGSPLGNPLDATLLPGSPSRPWRALISLHPGADGIDVERVRRAVAGVPQARVVEIGRELGDLYASYLREAMLQALLGALAVCALLAWHLRSAARLWRMCLPIAASVLIVLAVLTASGAALGVLHLVGFLLTVAIGSNYALFFDHLRNAGQADGDTLASLALANLTTVLSFGLLASSSIPVLLAIGQVVAPGALLCLLLSAALMPTRRH